MQIGQILKAVEVKRALKTLKNRSADGCDSIPGRKPGRKTVGFSFLNAEDIPYPRIPTGQVLREGEREPR